MKNRHIALLLGFMLILGFVGMFGCEDDDGGNGNTPAVTNAEGDVELPTAVVTGTVDPGETGAITETVVVTGYQPITTTIGLTN